jgi:hypothetical protein
MAGRARERGNAAHEGAADADDVQVHAQDPDPCNWLTSTLTAMK